MHIVADNSVGEEEEYSIGRDSVVGDDGLSLHYQADIEGYDFDEEEESVTSLTQEELLILRLLEEEQLNNGDEVIKNVPNYYSN